VIDPGVDVADVAMERYSNGDEAAFSDLYDAIAPRLLGYLRKATRDDSAAEDLMQLTLLHMHRARGSFIPGARVMPWAFAIARRQLTDSARRSRLERRLFSDVAPDDEWVPDPGATGAAADELLDAQRLQGRLQERLDALPDAQRTVYKLLQEEGMTLKAAADVMGTSVTAVKVKARRAYQALRAVFREPGDNG
jgi:RNA polymerase sigma-70 factor (ECF subfamily)